jgi:hypothetical protein
MSERTPSPSRYPYRRILTTLAGARAFKAVLIALGVGAACLAVATAGVPFEVTAQGSGNGQPSGDEDVKEMNKAFADYIESLKDLQKSFIAADAFRLDEAHAVGAYDLITAFMHSANRQNMGSSGAGRGRPRFTGFDDPDTRIGVDNPDTQYMGAIVDNSDCTQAFRIWGNRGNTADLILTTFDTSAGTGGGPTLEDEDMVNMSGYPLQLDEDYEVFAACQEIIDEKTMPGGDWEDKNTLTLPVSERMQIARRHTHCDWTVEHPEEVHIERLGTGGVPSPPLSAEVMTKQIRAGIFLNETQAPFWPAFVDSIKGNLPANRATPWQPTGGLGITTQFNMFMWFDAGDDPEAAVILRLPDEDVAAYMGLELSNFWGSSADWANRHVSMNWGLEGSCQAEQSAPTEHPAQDLISQFGGPDCGLQDAYYIVISAADPGVKNWIETAELSEGLLAGRLQSVPPEGLSVILGDPILPPPRTGLNSCMLPVGIPVPGPDAFPFPTDLATRVRIVLQQQGAFGDDPPPPPPTPSERAATIQMRQDFVREKYIFW